MCSSLIAITGCSTRCSWLFERERSELDFRVGSGIQPELDALRPAGWTSADAAGPADFPGLVRYDEVVSHG